MELSDLIEICRSWNRMGWAVQSQLESVLDGSPLEDQNPNALEMILDFLRDVDRTVAWCDDQQLRESTQAVHEQIADYLKELREHRLPA